MKITNKLTLPQPFVDSATREYQYKEKQYSVTSLLKGAMQTILERRYSDVLEQDVSDMVWLIFGNAVHKILEEAQETDEQLKENKLIIDVDGYKLSGIFDLYDAKEKKVVDYKTGTTWKVIYNEWDDYYKQLLIYAYMLKRIGFECNSGEIVMLLKDHSKTKAKTDSSYPQEPVYIKKFEFTPQDFLEVEDFIYTKFAVLKHCEKLPDDELPPCTPEERWHKGDTWAIKKEGRKTAIKVCQSEAEAQEYIKELDDKHFIEFREGKDGKCEDYCSVRDFCPFYKKKNEDNSNA